MKEIKIQNVKETIYKHKTKSGLTVYIWPYTLSDEISLSLTVLYGSVHTHFKYKGKNIKVPNGLAHFLEHVKFYEKKGVAAHDYFYKLGSYVNAYTTFNHTSYEVVCNSNVNDNLNHLLFFVFNRYFTKSLVQKEKPIIIEESKGALDNPYNMGYKALMNGLFYEDNRKNLVTGEEKDIKKITIDDITNVFDAFYKPSNMFLTVTGNVNPYEIEKIVDTFFENDILKKEAASEIIEKKEPDKVKEESQEIYTNVTKEKVFLAYKIPRKQFAGYSKIKIKMLFNLLLDINFSATSDFNENLINNQLIDNIFYTVWVNNTHVIVMFESSTSYPKKVTELVKEKFNNLAYDDDSFQRKINAHLASTILGYENASDVNDDIRSDVVNYGKVIDNVSSIIKSLKKQDLDNIINNLKKYQTSEVILKPFTQTKN